MLGSLSRVGTVTSGQIRRSMVYGTVMASFAVESFGVERLAAVDRAAIDARFDELVRSFSL
jgi:hypothetical protein